MAMGIDTGGGGFSGSSGVGGNDTLGSPVTVGGKTFNLSGPTIDSSNGIPTWAIMGGMALVAFWLYKKKGR